MTGLHEVDNEQQISSMFRWEKGLCSPVQLWGVVIVLNAGGHLLLSQRQSTFTANMLRLPTDSDKKGWRMLASYLVVWD